MILNEFDAYQEALKKINLNEEVMPIYKGRILTENVDIYCKIQKLLGCNAFEGAHRWLYDLDIENLDESECSKVCNLYQLGVDRGYIEDEEKTDECDLMAQTPDDVDSLQAAEEPTSEPIQPATELAAPPVPEAPMAAYTVVYSATRDGQIKTGEAYSNSLNTRSAKADVISKLEKAGYQNISILAIEAGDPDMSGCDNTFCKRSDYVPPTYEDEEEKVEEADLREPLAHALHPVGVNASTANTADQDAVEMTITEDEAKEEVKKAFDEVNNAFGDDEVEKDKTRKWLDDNKETIDKIRAALKPEDAKKLDIITKTLESFAAGKISEDEVDEAKGGKKPKSGVMTVIRGLFKILCTLVSLSGSTVGFSGKIVVWAGKIISAGADKVNMMLKDSEDEDQVNEDGEDEENSDDSAEDDAGKKEKDDEKEDSSKTKDDGNNNDDKADEETDKKEEDAEEPDEKLKDDKKEEDGEEDATDDKEEKELSAQEKSQLKDSYKKAFKAAMQKCKYFDKAFDDLTLEEKVKFFETIDDAWKNKADPTKFMTDKETEQLQKIKVKK